MKPGAKLAVYLIVMIMVIGIFWGIFNSMWDTSHKYIKAGCKPLTANQYGVPSTYECPYGTEIK